MFRAKLPFYFMTSRAFRIRAVFAVFGLGVALLPACQYVFGDFEQEDEPKASGGTPGTGGSTSTGAGTGTSTGPSVTGCTSDQNYFCNGSVLVNCATKATEDCGNATLCRSLEGKCLACVKDDYTCQGNVRVKCNATQTAWEVDTDCSTNPATPYCDAALKKCVECTSGSTKCDGTSLATCSNRRTWATTKSCLIRCVTDSVTSADCIDCYETFVAGCSGNSLKTCFQSKLLTTPCVKCVEAADGTPAYCGS